MHSALPNLSQHSNFLTIARYNNINTWLHWKVSKKFRRVGIGRGWRELMAWRVTTWRGFFYRVGLKAERDGAVTEAERVAQWKQWQISKRKVFFFSSHKPGSDSRSTKAWRDSSELQRAHRCSSRCYGFGSMSSANSSVYTGLYSYDFVVSESTHTGMITIAQHLKIGKNAT